ncbi:MAG: trypsin-like peptidase domain-containing protein [Gemmatimonadota bacterium]|jgi:serine protease Do
MPRIGWKRQLFSAACAALALGCQGGAQPAKQAQNVALAQESSATSGAVATMPAAARTPAPPQDTTKAARQQAVDVSRRTAIVNAAARVAPAVVSVNIVRRETVQPQSMWEEFFIPRGYQREVKGLGSGFIYDSTGLILTNAHVVRGAQEIVVTLADGRDFSANVVGTDEVTDIAVIRIPEPTGHPFPVAPLGNSTNLLIGEWVVAIGNPFGYLLSNPEPTVTVGVVSGAGRNIVPSGNDSGYYLDMIQTDASINPGNSGGPLVDADGHVIGVNSSILSRSGGSEGLGFAIPIDRARRVADDLVQHGEVRRAWVGVEVAPADSDRFGRSTAIRISRVADNSPARRAGLKDGEIIEAVGSHQVRTVLDWEAALLDARVGQPLAVRTARNTVRVVPRDLPSLAAERVKAVSDFELVTLTPAIRAERGLVSQSGALIVKLSEAARNVGLRQGDLILQINRRRVRTAEEAADLLKRLADQGPIQIIYERNRHLGAVSFYIR